MILLRCFSQSIRLMRFLILSRGKNMIIFTSQVGKMPLNLEKQLLRGKTNMIFASEKCPHATGPKYAVSTLKHKVLLLIRVYTLQVRKNRHKRWYEFSQYIRECEEWEFWARHTSLWRRGSSDYTAVCSLLCSVNSSCSDHL